MAKPSSSADRHARLAEDGRRRGAFVLRLPTGRRLRFKDAGHRAAAVSALSNRAYPTMLAFVEAAVRCPNGYSGFLDLGNPVRF